MQRIYRKRVYPVRETELPWIKRNRAKELRSVIGTDEPQKFELGMFEYIMFVTMFECSVSSIISHLDLVVRHGAILVSVSYIFITAILTMPIHMLLTFLGSYSKKSYLGLFSCAPLFEGLGFVIAAVRLTTEIYNSTLCGFAILIFYHCMTNTFKATFCKGLVKALPHFEECLTMFPKEPYNFTCQEKDIRLYTATQYYVRRAVVRYRGKGKTTPKMNYPALNAQILLWLAIFIVAVNGIKRVKTITINIQLIFGLIIASIVFLSLFHSHINPDNEFKLFGNETTWMSFNFWAEMILYSVNPQSFGNIMWLSTIKPSSLDPKFAVILTTQIKLLIYTITACFSAKIFQDNLAHYMILDHTCLPVNGFDILFCLIPDVLYRSGVDKLVTPLWYMMIFYFAFVTPLYTVIGLVDSISERFRILSRVRFYVCGSICSLLFLLSICLIMDVGGYAVMIWKSCSLPFVTSAILLLINVALFFAYSSKNILDDYVFTYGTKPEKYWLTFWKTAPIFSIFTFIFVGYNQYRKNECSGFDYVIFLAYFYTACLFLTVGIIGGIKCCTHIKTTEIINVSKPNSEWGPYNILDKETRKLFYPHREMRYRTTTLKCKHKCCCSYTGGYERRLLIEHAKLDKLERMCEEEEFTLYSESEDLKVSDSVISTDSSILGKSVIELK